MSNSTQKQNIKIPKLRFKGFSDGWKEENLGAISSDIMYGMNAASKKFDGKNIYLRITDIDESTGRLKYNSLTSPDGELEDKYKLKIGDLLFARTGASVGKTYIYKKDDGDLYFAGFLIKFSIKKAEPYFIYLITLQKKYWKWVKRVSMRSGQPGINANEYSDLKLTIPQIQEQQKIADFLGGVDSWLENLRKQKESLESYKKGMMQKIFSQEIRFKDDGGKGFPEWKNEKLGNICKITTGKLDANAMVDNGKYRFYTCAKEYYLIDKYAFDTEALLISGNGANVGYIHYYKGKFNAYQRTYVLDKFSENIAYVKIFLDANLSDRIFKEKKAGNTPYIVMDTLSDMTIKLPHIFEQSKITDFLNSLNELIELKQKQISYVEHWKKGLMQGLFV